MTIPNERDKEIALNLYDRGGHEVFLEDIEEGVAAYREEIELKARRQIREMRNVLENIVDHAENWYVYYCELYGERRKEQQNSIFDDIMDANTIISSNNNE